MQKNHEEVFTLSGRITGKLDHLRWVAGSPYLNLSDYDKERIVSLLSEVIEDQERLFKKILNALYGELTERKDETGA